MNNIHEKDWAEDSWAGHSGKNSCSGRKIANKEIEDKPVANTDENESSTEKDKYEPLAKVQSCHSRSASDQESRF